MRFENEYEVSSSAVVHTLHGEKLLRVVAGCVHSIKTIGSVGYVK